jgi:hypothetical protein
MVMFGSMRILEFPKGSDDLFAHKVIVSTISLDIPVCLYFPKSLESLYTWISESHDINVMMCII